MADPDRNQRLHGLEGRYGELAQELASLEGRVAQALAAAGVPASADNLAGLPALQSVHSSGTV